MPTRTEKGPGKNWPRGLLMAGIGVALLPIAVIAVIGAVLYRRAGPRAWIYWALAILTAGIGLAILGGPTWAADYEHGYADLFRGQLVGVALWLPVAVPAGCITGLALGRVWRYLAKRSRHNWPVLPVPQGRARWFRRDTTEDYAEDMNLNWNGKGLRPAILDDRNEKAAQDGKRATDAPIPGRFTLGYTVIPGSRKNRRLPTWDLMTAQYHLLVLSQPGGGKTYSLVIPNVLQWAGAVVVSTTKLTEADILANTFSARSRMGAGALVFDPSGQSGYDFPGWNPLRRARESWDSARKVAQALAAGSGAGAQQRDSTGEFFQVTATNMLAPYLRAAGLANRDMLTILRWLQASGKAHDAALTEVRAILEAQGPGVEADALGGLSGAAAGSADSIGDTHQTVIKLLSTWQSDRVRQLTRDSSWDMEEFLESHGTLYLLSLENSEEFRPLFTMLVSELFAAGERVARRNGGMLDPPIAFILDETANICPIPDLDQRLATTREWARIMTVWQDLAQIEKLYGEVGARILKGSTDSKMVFRIGEISTAEWVAKELGEKQYDQVVYSPARRIWDVAPQPTVTPRVTVPRASPDEIMAFGSTLEGDRRALVFPAGEPGHEVRLRGWEQDAGIARHLRVVPGEDEALDGDCPGLPDPAPAGTGDGAGRVTSMTLGEDSMEWPIYGPLRSNGHHLEPNPDDELALAMAEDDEDEELDLDLPLVIERLEDREEVTRMARSR